MFFNSQSACNKTLLISDFICECDFDVVAISETWLKSTIDANMMHELTPKGYSHELLSRSCYNIGCGFALQHKSTIVMKKPDHKVYHSFEHILDILK